MVVCFTSSPTSPSIVAENGIAVVSNNQLNGPNRMSVNDAQTLYIAGTQNHRVKKWAYRASSDATTASTRVMGSHLTHLSFPGSLVVDSNGYVNIADRGNNRIVRWSPDGTSGDCVVVATGTFDSQASQLACRIDLAFDSNGYQCMSATTTTVEYRNSRFS